MVLYYHDSDYWTELCKAFNAEKENAFDAFCQQKEPADEGQKSLLEAVKINFIGEYISTGSQFNDKVLRRLTKLLDVTHNTESSSLLNAALKSCAPVAFVNSCIAHKSANLNEVCSRGNSLLISALTAACLRIKPDWSGRPIINPKDREIVVHNLLLVMQLLIDKGVSITMLGEYGSILYGIVHYDGFTENERLTMLQMVEKKLYSNTPHLGHFLEAKNTLRDLILKLVEVRVIVDDMKIWMGSALALHQSLSQLISNLPEENAAVLKLIIKENEKFLALKTINEQNLSKHIEFLRKQYALFSNGFDEHINFVNNSDISAAIKQGNYQIAKSLLNSGVYPWIRNADKKLPVHTLLESLEKDLSNPDIQKLVSICIASGHSDNEIHSAIEELERWINSPNKQLEQLQKIKAGFFAYTDLEYMQKKMVRSILGATSNRPEDSVSSSLSPFLSSGAVAFIKAKNEEDLIKQLGELNNFDLTNDNSEVDNSENRKKILAHLALLSKDINAVSLTQKSAIAYFLIKNNMLSELKACGHLLALNNAQLQYAIHEYDNEEIALAIIPYLTNKDLEQHHNSQDALMDALSCWRYSVVKALLNRGVDYNNSHDDNKSFMHMLVMSGENEALTILQSLLECKNINLTAIDNEKRSVWHYAAMRHEMEALKLLLNHDKKRQHSMPLLDALDRRKRTALHLAIENQHFETAKILIEAGANVNAKDCIGETPLHIAANSCNVDCVRLLLDHDADAKTNGEYGVPKPSYEMSKTFFANANETNLHLAFARKNSTEVKKLIEFKELTLNTTSRITRPALYSGVGLGVVCSTNKDGKFVAQITQVAKNSSLDEKKDAIMNQEITGFKSDDGTIHPFTSSKDMIERIRGAVDTKITLIINGKKHELTRFLVNGDTFAQYDHEKDFDSICKNGGIGREIADKSTPLHNTNLEGGFIQSNDFTKINSSTKSHK